MGGTRTGGRWVAAGVVFLLGSLAVTACGGDAADGAESPDAEDGTFGRVINVETRQVVPQRFVEVVSLTGTVEANRDVRVSAEESGVIRQVFVEKGSVVRAGQPIARIDDRILRSQVEQAAAQASLARETWERRKRLYEEDGIGSELAYLEAKYAAEQAEANVSTLRQRLERTVVTAPISGVLDERSVEVGTMVGSGTHVARIVELDPVKITAGVPERYATDVDVGSRATVRFDVLDGQSFDGVISYVGSAVNPRNRTFPVEFTLPNPGRAIKPEMVADVEVTRRTLDSALVVPQEALVRVEEGYVVFVVVEEGGEMVADQRIVTLGPSQRNEVVVTRGLQPGDELIVLGQKQVAAGDRVRVVTSASSGPPASGEAPAAEEQDDEGQPRGEGRG